tara:strand:+ start:18308 stop:18880 length:573 start_codon:yes stop_codon:yes gene_type:complete
MLNYLYGKFPNCSFYGSDIIPQSIQLAKEKTNNSIEYFVDDITNKNDTQLRCDIIISVGVFQIYDDINSLIQNYISRTNKDGYILIEGPFSEHGVDVNITYRDNKNTKSGLIDQGGWNVWSLIYLETQLKEIKEVESYEFIPVSFPDDLQIDYKKEDPLRSWTVNIDGKNKFLNALILQDHYIIKLKVSK